MGVGESTGAGVDTEPLGASPAVEGAGDRTGMGVVDGATGSAVGAGVGCAGGVTVGEGLGRGKNFTAIPFSKISPCAPSSEHSGVGNSCI